jgi:uncharacterized protein
MKILFYLSHPSQYHVHKNTISGLIKNGKQVRVLIRRKDILEKLLLADKVDFKVIQGHKKRKGKIGIVADLIAREINFALILLRERQDLLIGSDASVSHLSKLFSIPSLVFAEDDVQIIPALASLMYPAATAIVAPEPCDTGKWTYKKISYNGYQKLAYLHPNHFSPDRDLVISLGFSFNRPNYLFRLSGFEAHHDAGICGFSIDQIKKLISILEPIGNILVSSEINLPAELQKYSFSFAPEMMHHILAFSDILICDSQSMAVEAAILGVPSLRFNDFAGRISVLEELEKKYSLTFGFSTSSFNALLAKLEEILVMKDRKGVFNRRKLQMLSEKTDVAAFFLWLIEGYPESVRKMKSDPDYRLTSEK